MRHHIQQHQPHIRRKHFRGNTTSTVGAQFSQFSVTDLIVKKVKYILNLVSATMLLSVANTNTLQFEAHLIQGYRKRWTGFETAIT